MRVKVGSVAFLKAAGSGYSIGLDDAGHRIEFMGDWRTLSGMQPALSAREAVYADVEDWQVLAVDDELRRRPRPRGDGRTRCVPAIGRDRPRVNRAMAPLAGMSRHWTEVEANMPHGWELRGVVKGPRQVDPTIPGSGWVAWAIGDGKRTEGTGESAEATMQDLSNQLRRCARTPHRALTGGRES